MALNFIELSGRVDETILYPTKMYNRKITLSARVHLWRICIIRIRAKIYYAAYTSIIIVLEYYLGCCIVLNSIYRYLPLLLLLMHKIRVHGMSKTAARIKCRLLYFSKRTTNVFRAQIQIHHKSTCILY